MPLDGSNLQDWQITLLKAAEIVRERWCQGNIGNDGEPRCATGALLEATVGGFKEAYEALGRAVGEIVPQWNDAPGRTAEEVARVMESVATQGRE